MPQHPGPPWGMSLAARAGRPLPRLTPCAMSSSSRATPTRPLATSICDHLGVTLSDTAISRFSNDCLQAQLLANCRQRDVYIVQPLVPPTQDS